MKNIISFSFLFVLSLANPTFAQSPYAQIFTYELDTPHCYSKTDYPTSEEATKKFLEIHFGFSICETDCTFPGYPSCKAKLINEDGLEETATQWCFIGYLRFGWLCSKIQNGAEVEEEPEKKKKQVNESLLSAIQTFVPNPSTGKSYLEISAVESSANIELIIMDYTGRSIQQQQYEINSSENLRLPVDLSEAGNGLYYVSIKVNGIIIKTNKLLIQH